MEKLVISGSAFFFIAFFLISCEGEPTKDPNTEQSQTETPQTLNTKVQLVDNPAGELSGEPNLTVSKNGKAYLSWVEHIGEKSNNLQFANFDGKAWGQPQTIASGDNWFVNWADFPSMVVSDDNENALAAHWLAMRAEGTYDYDVQIAQSQDGGKTWSAPFLPHTDGIAAEHGFVSMQPLEDGKIFATWLDGRLTKTEGHDHDSHDHDHGHGGGPMTLRAASFDQNGNLHDEVELDGKVCDCCQTDAAITSNGPIVVYRDRSDSEVRDISIVRKVDGKWTAPKSVHVDNWEIAGCPVNGPSVAAEGEQAVVAWFSAPEQKSSVKIAFSEDAGASFGQPIQVNTNKTIGRVDLLLVAPQLAFVSWMEETKEKTEIRAAYFTPEGKKGEDIIISNADASRRSGFPRLANWNDDFLVAWTSVTGDSTKIQTAIITKP